MVITSFHRRQSSNPGLVVSLRDVSFNNNRRDFSTSATSNPELGADLRQGKSVYEDNYEQIFLRNGPNCAKYLLAMLKNPSRIPRSVFQMRNIIIIIITEIFIEWTKQQRHHEDHNKHNISMRISTLR